MGRRAGLAAAAVVGGFAVVTTMVGVASGAPLEFLVADLLTGLSFVVAGLAAAWLRPGSPAGPMLIACGFLWYVGSYAPTGQPIVTYLGFAFERYYDLVLAALLLILSSVPQRLEPRFLFGALAGAFAVRSAGRLFLQDPVVTYGCASCTPNPFALTTDPAVFEAVEVASSLAIAGLIVAVGAMVLVRLLRAGPLLRKARWPILVAGGLAMAAAAFDAFEYAWTTATQVALVEVAEPWDFVFEWGLFGARVLVPVGFLIATLRLRGVPGPLGPLAARLEDRGASATGDALRAALGDPSLALLLRGEDGAWTTEDGVELAWPGELGGQHVTLVAGSELPLAAIVHDPVLLDQPELLDGVVRVLRLALENERLESELRRQLEVVTESRRRIVTAAEDERRRLERDLHDGAQQQLIGVMLAIQQARSAAEKSGAAPEIGGQLDAAMDAANDAIRELRELARGIHPAILEDEGLGSAVTALARRASLPVELRLELDGRLSPLAESTAYFTIAEALTNAQRHAMATQATVRVTQSHTRLEVEVRDDGVGGAEPARGSGLRGLADRVTALGGSLVLDSPPTGGTAVRASIPLP